MSAFQTSTYRWKGMQVATGGLVCLALLAAPFVLRIRTDNSLERWVEPGGVTASQYAQFKTDFGSDEFIVVAVSGKPLFEETALDAMLTAAHRLEDVPQVSHVLGLPTIYRDLFGGEDQDALRKEFFKSPFYEGLFLARDGETAGIFLELDPANGPRTRQSLVQEVTRAVQPLRDSGFHVALAGPPVLNVELDLASEREALRLFPIAFFCSIGVLWLLLRSLRATLVAMACAAVGILLTLGLIAVVHGTMNMLSSALPSLLWVLALANSVHIFWRYQRTCRPTDSIRAALEVALAETGMPCTVASVTTAAGFLSLVFAPMRPVQEVGIWGALGILLTLVSSLTLTPVLTLLLRPPSRTTSKYWSLLTVQLIQVTSRLPLLIVGVSLMLMLLAVGSLRYLRVECNTLKFLPTNNAVVQAYEFVGKNLTGVHSLEVVIRTPDTWLNPEVWSIIEKMTQRLAAHTGVPRVVSPLDILRKANQVEHDFDASWYRLPQTKKEARALLETLPDTLKEGLARLVTADGRQARLSVLVNTLDPQTLEDVISEARAEVAAVPQPFSGLVTGLVLGLSEAQRDLVTTQIKSLGFALGAILGIILVGLRSWTLTGISVLPNLLPVLVMLMTMAALAIPLDPATVMVAGISLGIAVDDTVHFLAVYRRLRRMGRDGLGAVRETITELGPAMTITTITASSGFLTLYWSDFVPLRYFGILTAIALGVALAADLLFVPAMLILWHNHARSSNPPVAVDR